jgi:hypothetical protein
MLIHIIILYVNSYSSTQLAGFGGLTPGGLRPISPVFQNVETQQANGILHPNGILYPTQMTDARKWIGMTGAHQRHNPSLVYGPLSPRATMEDVWAGQPLVPLPLTHSQILYPPFPLPTTMRPSPRTMNHHNVNVQQPQIFQTQPRLQEQEPKFDQFAYPNSLQAQVNPCQK